MIYSWAKEQERDKKASSYLKQKNPKKASAPDSKTQDKTSKCDTSQPLELPVHTNRTMFKHADLLVPWKTKKKDDEEQPNGDTLHRFYHVFEEGELEEVIAAADHSVVITHSYYDKGNWCCMFQKGIDENFHDG